MVTVDLAWLEQLAQAATPGPWYVVENDLVGGVSIANVAKPMSEIRPRKHVVVADMMARSATSDLIAACSPEVVQQLVRAVKAAQSVIDDLSDHVLTSDAESTLYAALAPFRSAP